jgi:sigma-B regulation protein RsbU (phosphoserine phosphatase)
MIKYLGKVWRDVQVNSRNLRWWQDVILLALTYFLLGYIGLKLPQNQYGSPFWPPVGVALGCLLSMGTNRWLGVFLGALSVSVFINKVPIYLALITASSPTIGCLVSAYLINKLTQCQYPLDRVRNTFIFVVTSLLTGTVYQSLMGVTIGAVIGFIKWENLLSSFVNWWAGDGIGILVFTPLVLSWFRSVYPLPWHRKWELLFISLSLLIVADLTLINNQPIEYLLIPPLLWSAFRLGDKITFLLVGIVASTSVLATAYGMGIFFKSAQVNNSLVLLQLFIGVISVTTMTVLSIVNENQATQFMLSHQIKLTTEAFENLDALNKNLEKIVEERTLEITKLNEQLKAENIRMSSELEITRRLQAMILPTETELNQITALDIAGLMQPADEVGGDYYDVLHHNGQIKIGIGDVTGHGLESGVIMLMVQTAIRTLMLQGETDRFKFLAVINQIIYENIKRMKSDRNLSLLLLDYDSGNLYLSGQHESILVIRNDGTIEEIDTDAYGFPIGLVEDITDFIGEAKITVHPGDVIILYTDGITEAVDPRREHYGIERLKTVALANRCYSAKQIRESIIADLHKFIAGYKVFDDITLVVVKLKKGLV